MSLDNIQRRTVLKRSVLGAGVVGLSSLAGCIGGGNGGGGGNTITIASSYESDHVTVQAADRFKEIVEDEADELTVEVVPGGSYGGEGEIAEQVREGAIQAHADSRWPFTQYAPEYEFVNIPIVFDDFEHLTRVTESEEFQPGLEQIISEGNQRMIGQWIDRGLRHFTSNEPVREPADVEGVDLRLPPLDNWVAIWEEIGANPTTVALDELYSALQTGTVGASEGDIPQIHSFNLNEVQDYLSYTGHHVQVGALYMNEDFYQGLDESHQDLVDEASNQATQEISESVRDQISEMESELQEGGMELIEDVNREAFKDAARPVVESMFDDFAGSLDQWQSI
ncbi:TRAP transporter substrate-binding protein [Natrinema sp. LN54]|uniref:TRAP transporter substrate-binding protein n=1 Tax=Natrinema sp. LN54 TaxID=3458705 RepID=UPI00403659D3